MTIIGKDLNIQINLSVCYSVTHMWNMQLVVLLHTGIILFNGLCWLMG